MATSDPTRIYTRLTDATGRALIEADISRWKRVIGDALCARTRTDVR